MAGLCGEFKGEELERGNAVLSSLEGETVNFVIDVCANALSDAIANVVRARLVDHAERTKRAELIADEVAENIKLLLRQRHPEVFGIPAGVATGTAH
jgi:hypothetical protein